MIPYIIAVSSVELLGTTKGPPESPWQAPFSPSVNQAHTIFLVISSIGYEFSLPVPFTQFELVTKGKWTYFRSSDFSKKDIDY